MGMSHTWALSGWSVQQFLRDYAAAIEDGTAALFCGAGTSIPAGMVNWRALLKPIADDLGLEMDRVTDLLSLAQYGHNTYKRHRLNEEIVQEFARAAKPNRLQDALVRLPIDMVWTSNYDTTLEDTYRRLGQLPDVKVDRATIAIRVRGADVSIYKMHGDVSRPDEAVLTKDDYEQYGSEARGRAFRTALETALFSRTFLFVGFSFNDPNLEQILSHVRVLIGPDNARSHYCIMTRPPSPAGTTGTELADREYQWRRMQLQIEDLKERYKIRTVLVDEYTQIDALLERLGAATRRNAVFISGAAERYAPFDRARLEDLLERLGRRLQSEAKSLISGMGVGIGSYVAQAFFTSAYERGEDRRADRAVLRPFPQAARGGGNLAAMWEAHRTDMIGRAGFVIYVAGNRSGAAPGDFVRSSGMDREFEIAQRLGALPVPIGATGDVAADIWRRVSARPVDFYPPGANVADYLATMGDGTRTNDAIVDAVFKLMNEANRAADSAP